MMTAHAIRRAWDRYGLRLTEADYHEVLEEIRTASTLLQCQHDGLLVWLIVLRGVPVAVVHGLRSHNVVDRRRGGMLGTSNRVAVVTFLPLSSPRRWDVTRGMIDDVRERRKARIRSANARQNQGSGYRADGRSNQEGAGA